MFNKKNLICYLKFFWRSENVDDFEIIMDF